MYKNVLKFIKNLNIKINLDLLLILPLFIFILIALYFVFKIPFGTPPDELWHITNIIYRNQDLTAIFIENSENYKILGDISTKPFLYHYLLGLILNFNFLDLPIYIYLRLINVLISVGTLVIIWRSTIAITKNRIVSSLSIVIFSNLLMFQFLSASISYDNLANLASALILFSFINLFNNINVRNLIYLSITLLFAILIKNTLIPFICIVIFTISIKMFIDRKELRRRLINIKEYKNLKTGILIFVLIFLALLNTRLYIGNIVNYGSWRVNCARVETVDFCKNFGPFNRNSRLEANPINDPITLPEAIDSWSSKIYGSVNGILSHEKSINGVHKQSANLYYIISIFMIFIFIKNIKNYTKSHLLFLVPFILYIFVLFYFNYDLRQKYGIWIAVQGRYLFPSIPFILIFLMISFKSINRILWQIVVVILMFVIPLISFYTFTQTKLNVENTTNWDQISDENHSYNRYLE